jgi:hypothetical protein
MMHDIIAWNILISPDTTLCDKVCQWHATGQWFSPGTPVSAFLHIQNLTPWYNWNIVESGLFTFYTMYHKIRLLKLIVKCANRVTLG